MECPSCKADVPEGSRFCDECGAPAPVGCPTCGACNRAGAKFCATCGGKLGAVTPATLALSAAISQGPAAERRQLTVMFCDLEGSTALSHRLDPEEMRDVLRGYQNAVAGEIARFEGHVAKLMGDGVLAYFGWPRAHEDEAERAVRAGLAVATAVGQLPPVVGTPLACRIGIATGAVVVGDLIGEGAAREEAVVGETPNLAARLQELAAPGTVAIAEGTRRLLGELFELAELGRRTLKGFAEPVPAWRVLGESRAEGRFAALHGTGVLPLVGRDYELALLLERWRLAKGGEGQVVLLAGEPGIGKSRIVQALRECLGEEPLTSLRYHCSPYHTNSTLWPVSEQLQRAAGLAAEEPPEGKYDKLAALLAQALDDVTEAAALLSDLLAIPTDGRWTLPPLAPQEKKAQTLRALVRQIEGLAEQRPVLLILEDAHWLDPTTRELFDAIVDRVEALPVFVVVTFRPEFRPPWTGRPHVTSLTLNRLDRASVLAIINRHADGKALPAEVVETIQVRTDGVPLFVEELTKAVLESSLLRRTAGGFVLDGPLPPLAIPSTLHDSLIARLDRSAPVKEVAQIGAVIGREFDHEVLAAAASMDQAALADALRQLVEAELVFRRSTLFGVTFTFKHALVRDTAYASLLKPRRQQLHARIAEVLETRFPAVGQAQPEVVAHHFTEAGLAKAATPYWHQAGQRAAARSANLEAIAHIAKGLDLVPTLPETPERQSLELQLQLTLGSVLIQTKGYAAEEVEQTYLRARELSRQVGDSERLFSATWGLWLLHQTRMQLKRSRALVDELLDLGARSNNEDMVLQSHHSAWTGLFYLGEHTTCIEHTKFALRLYDRNRHGWHKLVYGGHDPGVCGRAHRSLNLWLVGCPTEARAAIAEAVGLAGELKHGSSEVLALTFMAHLYVFLRDASAAREVAASAGSLAAAQGVAPHYQAANRIIEGWAAVVEGNDAEGIGALRSGLKSLQATGVRIRLSFYRVLLAEALALAGRPGEASRALDDAQAFVEETGETWWEPELHRMRAELLVAGSRLDWPQAEACLGRALELARSRDARMLELRAAMSLARLWAAEGERQKACDLLGPAYGWFTEGFDTQDLKVAKALLDEVRQ